MDKRFSILIVDDNPGIRLLLSEVVISWGFTVDSAAGGQEALAKVLTNRYDVALVDFNMPGINGLETIAQIRAITTQIRFVALASSSEADLIKQAIDCGLVDYIACKPFDLKKLQTILRTCKKGNRVKSQNNQVN